jgi:hypothetical protein
MQQIEFETSFGLVAASEQALVDVLRELLLQPEPTAPEDLLEAVRR